MPALCLCFDVHEAYRLRKYTVFDIGQNSVYEDDDRNCDALIAIARSCYLPMTDLLLKLIRRHKKAFKCSFAISGTALDQFEQYAPEVIDGFKALAATGCVEFVSGPSAYSLAFLYSEQEFERQVKEHSLRLKGIFGKKPLAFRNTEFMYSNELAQALKALGFKAILAEGAEHVLGWRSPNYVYTAPGLAEPRLLLRNMLLSEDVSIRFSNRGWSGWPLTTEKFAGWCSGADDADIINLYWDYHAFGMRHDKESGILDFMEAFPAAMLADKRFSFMTPSEAAKKIEPKGEVDVLDLVSWRDNERDLTMWLGNDMQKDAVHALYALDGRVRALGDAGLIHDYERLQTAEHFSNISTKWFTGYLADRSNPFESPYDAYITYMNVLADFEMRLAAAEKAASKKKTAGGRARPPKKKTDAQQKK
ncbi:MAG: glycoside hydrolase family 57 protein [Desulfovibrio sp.]|jgi:alpha-amylase|nr:glycoside hydrolase family 57 protein [Desulfovibrio sp.]